MRDRLGLHEELCTLIGSRNVYFQPPESVKLIYPCIVYSISKDSDIYANDSQYIRHDGYDVTTISKDPDETFKEELKSTFTYCDWVRSYISDNLNHNVYKIYY